MNTSHPPVTNSGIVISTRQYDSITRLLEKYGRRYRQKSVNGTINRYAVRGLPISRAAVTAMQMMNRKYSSFEGFWKSSGVQ